MLLCCPDGDYGLTGFQKGKKGEKIMSLLLQIDTPSLVCSIII